MVVACAPPRHMETTALHLIRDAVTGTYGLFVRDSDLRQQDSEHQLSSKVPQHLLPKAYTSWFAI